MNNEDPLTTSQHDNHIKHELPTRLTIAVMLFLMVLTSYMARVNFSVILLAMVHSGKNVTYPDFGPRYEINARHKAHITDAYFYGFMITSLPGGVLADRYGGKAVAGFSTLFAAFFTALIPFTASYGLYTLFFDRFAIGFFGGVISPCCHCLIAKWAPIYERNKFVATLMGGTFGTAVTLPLSGIIVEEFGWPTAFFAIAFFIFAIAVAWFCLVADSPTKHKRISIVERNYIQKSLGDTISMDKQFLPFFSVIKSLPFWSLAFLHFGSLWGLFFLITSVPKYLHEVLGLNLAKAGFIATFPHLARFISAFAFGAIADYIRREGILSVTKIRKLFCISSHILPGFGLLLVGVFGGEDDYFLTVGLMTISLGCNGAAAVTNQANIQDLAPNFAGSLYGAINFIGTVNGLLSPVMVAYFTENQNTHGDWAPIFLYVSLGYIVPVFVFWAFGSGETQPWNYIKKKESLVDPLPIQSIQNIQNIQSIQNIKSTKTRPTK